MSRAPDAKPPRRRKAPANRRAPAGAASRPAKAAPPLPAQARERNDRWIAAAVCVFLAAVAWAVFGPTVTGNSLRYDDPEVVFEEPNVSSGLNVNGVLWAFTHPVLGHWDPITTLSHMADCSVYGLAPWGHHLTNVLLHGTSMILLFLLLKELTGTLWRSAFAAALFGLHPLRVESVAWITERKDVLSGVFFMLTLWAYIRYARRRSLCLGRGLFRLGAPVQVDARHRALRPVAARPLAIAALESRPPKRARR